MGLNKNDLVLWGYFNCGPQRGRPPTLDKLFEKLYNYFKSDNTGWQG